MLGMKKFFTLYDYLEKMKENIATLSLKGKYDIWLEGMKNVKGIHEEDLTCHAFEMLLNKKYLLMGTMMTYPRIFMSYDGFYYR